MDSKANMPVTAVTKTDLVVESVISSIINEQYKPGDRLPAESYYVQNCGVSRVTVREAFKKLNSMGVVSIRQGDGTFVHNIKPFEIKNVLLPLLMANKQMVDDLYETRIIIEQSIIELVIERKTPDNVKELQIIVRDMENAVDNSDLNMYSTADIAFHDALKAMCGNSILENIYDSLSLIRRENITKCNISLEAIRKSIVEHKYILEAIVNNDAERAKKILKDQLLYSRKMAYQNLNFYGANSL